MTRRQIRAFPIALLLMAAAMLLLSTGACGGGDDSRVEIQQDGKPERTEEVKNPNGEMELLWDDSRSGEPDIFRFHDPELDMYCYMGWESDFFYCFPGRHLREKRRTQEAPGDHQGENSRNSCPLKIMPEVWRWSQSI